ncbi:hypothetical protein ABIB06_004232, partial [Bradyrhizobium sp. LB8.2]
TVIHPRHRSLPRIITQLTESAIKFLRNMCEFDRPQERGEEMGYDL